MLATAITRAKTEKTIEKAMEPNPFVEKIKKSDRPKKPKDNTATMTEMIMAAVPFCVTFPSLWSEECHIW